MIETRGLTKTFHVHKKEPGLWGSVRSLFRRELIAKHAVRDVTLRIDEGEIVGLVGANGAGKTTLVKMLAGIIHPTSGEARVLGSVPWERDDRLRSRLALIMGQKAQLWWDLPAADGFLLLKEIYRIPDEQYRETLASLTSVLDVGKELKVQLRRLSLGERMKMELIAALLHRPSVVYLDEPTIGLDLSAQRAIRDFILDYSQRHSPAMLLTSHYMEDIERLCKRILILRDGALVFDGPLKEVVERYADHKVIVAHLRREVLGSGAREAVRAVGEIVEEDETLLKVRVPRGSTASAAGRILSLYPVADLAIEEPDIGTIIERIMREKGTA